MKENDIYEGHIHDEAYMEPYRQLTVTADSLITGRRPNTELLDGPWNYCVDPYDTAIRMKWFEEPLNDADGRQIPWDFDFDHWPVMNLPAVWNLQDPMLFYYEHPVVFTRTFLYQNHGEDRVVLRFGAVQYAVTVALNGRAIVYHQGGSTPFVVDVTDAIQPENRIMLIVENIRRRDRVPMSNTDWFNYGGVHRSIELLRLPKVAIRNHFISLVPDGTYSKIDCAVELTTATATLEAAGGAGAIGGAGAAGGAGGAGGAGAAGGSTGAGADGGAGGAGGAGAAGAADSAGAVPNGPASAGKPQGGSAPSGSVPTVKVRIPELGVQTELPVVDGRVVTQFDIKPELWSPESPKLYDVEITCGADTVVDRIGFRQIERSGADILLNGKPIFLRGVSAHEESVANGRTMTEAEIRENFAIAKRMGCNFMRLAHYPHSGRASEIADEVGILLWEEIPVYWAIDFENDATLADARNQLAELILRDRNRAGVIIWSVGNENPDTNARLAFMGALADRARELDGTRLVSAACLIDRVKYRIADRLADKLDVIGVNQYLGWYDPDFSKLPQLMENSKPDKPVIITEFGAGAPAGVHGTADEMFTEEFQERVYREQTRVISGTPYIKGMSPWILYDFRSPRRFNRFQNGYNRKGLLSEDKRREKKAFFVLQDFYRAME